MAAEVRGRIATGRLTLRSSRPRAVRWSGAEAPRALHLHVSVPQAREGTRPAERKNVVPPELLFWHRHVHGNGSSISLLPQRPPRVWARREKVCLRREI